MAALQKGDAKEGSLTGPSFASCSGNVGEAERRQDLPELARRQVLASEDAIDHGGAASALPGVRRREPTARRKPRRSRRRDTRSPGTRSPECDGSTGAGHRASTPLRVSAMRRVHGRRTLGAVAAAVVHRLRDRIGPGGVGLDARDRGGNTRAGQPVRDRRRHSPDSLDNAATVGDRRRSGPAAQHRARPSCGLYATPTCRAQRRRARGPRSPRTRPRRSGLRRRGAALSVISIARSGESRHPRSHGRNTAPA
jgi:hypothetical protein